MLQTRRAWPSNLAMTIIAACSTNGIASTCVGQATLILIDERLKQETPAAMLRAGRQEDRRVLTLRSLPEGRRSPWIVPGATPRNLARRLVRRFTLKQITTLLGLLGFVIIVAGTSFIAWNERRVLFAEARDHAEQSAAYLADHAKRLFEVSDLVLHAADTTVAGKSGDEIEGSSDLMANLRRLDDMLPYVQTVFVTDATGQVRATTLDGRPPYSVADRSVFQDAMRSDDTRLLVGEVIVGRVTGLPTFLVARRRTDVAGRFEGIVGSAMALGYFTDYWRTLDKRNDEEIALVRAGTGSVLVRYPAGPEDANRAHLGPGLLEATQGGREEGTFEPRVHAMATFRRIGDLPLYVTVVFKDSVINAQWNASLWRLLPLATTALLGLAVMMALALRLVRREEVARATLRASNARLEQRVAERTADLLESNREIQRFAHIVSHDLRAPLVNIMGFTAELEGLVEEVLHPAAPLEDARKGQVGTEFAEAFGFIQSSIDKMDRLIKAILTLSRQGQRVLRPEPLDMDALMRSVADGVAHRAGEAGASIAIGLMPAITADRIAVEQVFANLVDNAVKYLRDEVAGVIAITAMASVTTATYRVTDNGRGIRPDDRERVFDLFRRAGKQDRPGEGIGLANVRSLIRRLQGTITLDSVPGSGCVFTVTLPRDGR